ncbi:MAG: transglycosylase SLT domain-containing protein [Bacilli bacterium]
MNEVNKLVFCVDENDSVKKCEYIEPCYDYGSAFATYNIIDLPDIELHNLFFDFLKNNYQIEPKKEGNDLIFTFYDVDVDKMDALIERSKLLKEQKQKEIERENEREIEREISLEDEDEVQRTNKFKKMPIISVSAALLLTLAGFYTFKNHNTKDDTKSNKDNVPGIEYNDDEFSKDEHNDNSYDYEKNEVLINDATEDNSLENQSNIDTTDNVINNKEQNDKISYDEELDNVEVDAVLKLEFDDEMDSEKYYKAKQYYDTISYYADAYGIDPVLALAVASHERGEHSNTVDRDGGLGLFQIQVEGGWNWVDKYIRAYNFKTGEYDEFKVELDDVKDIDKNVQVACMILQNLLMKYNYNVAEAITAYNYGENYLWQVLNRCSQETGMSISDLNNLDCLEWLNYRSIIAGGDPQYLENVFKYIPNGTILNFKMIDGSELNIEYQNARNLTRGIG